ncbi:hypothetical protein [Streptomyces sp. NPDC058726]|uniref:hypothetical protein n=1 Tax=Streptomyces sp. NPDC058726 TaxID=3346611 RepID=UPI00369D08AC
MSAELEVAQLLVGLVSAATAFLSASAARRAHKKSQELSAQFAAGEVLAYVTRKADSADPVYVVDNRSDEEIRDVQIRVSEAEFAIAEIPGRKSASFVASSTAGDGHTANVAPIVLNFSDGTGRKWVSDSSGVKIIGAQKTARYSAFTLVLLSASAALVATGLTFLIILL